MAIHKSPKPDPRDLKLFGPRLEIRIGAPILAAGSTAASDPATEERFSDLPALIDTGAQRIVIAPEAVLKVGLSKINETTLIRVGGVTENVGVYVASIQFPRSKFAPIEAMEVTACEVPHPPIKCLLGRDVLSGWTFLYDGPSGAWEIREDVHGGWIEPPEGFDLWGEK